MNKKDKINLEEAYLLVLENNLRSLASKFDNIELPDTDDSNIMKGSLQQKYQMLQHAVEMSSSGTSQKLQNLLIIGDGTTTLIQEFANKNGLSFLNIDLSHIDDRGIDQSKMLGLDILLIDISNGADSSVVNSLLSLLDVRNFNGTKLSRKTVVVLGAQNKNALYRMNTETVRKIMSKCKKIQS
jgi:hypothetical protein